MFRNEAVPKSMTLSVFNKNMYGEKIYNVLYNPLLSQYLVMPQYDTVSKSMTRRDNAVRCESHNVSPPLVTSR